MNETWAIAGHRGARGEAPENTLAGFRYAVQLGLQSVELDVQLSSDEELMVIHDDTVDRTTDGQGLVSEMTRAELGALDARSVFTDWPEPCPVPTLGEVFDVLGPMADITVEIKSDLGARLERVVPKVIAEVRSRNLVKNVTITSFDPVALEIAQQLLPEGQRGLTGTWDRSDYLDRAIELGCCRADVAVYGADADVVAAAKASGLRIMVWTVNTSDELRGALTLAPDLICTDVPGTLRAG